MASMKSSTPAEGSASQDTTPFDSLIANYENTDYNKDFETGSGTVKITPEGASLYDKVREKSFWNWACDTSRHFNAIHRANRSDVVDSGNADSNDADSESDKGLLPSNDLRRTLPFVVTLMELRPLPSSPSQLRDSLREDYNSAAALKLDGRTNETYDAPLTHHSYRLETELCDFSAALPDISQTTTEIGSASVETVDSHHNEEADPVHSGSDLRSREWLQVLVVGRGAPTKIPWDLTSDTEPLV